MKRYLPPFAAIRAFEVAAKHSNFKSAADEIHLSASAISHQIRALEDFLDTTLFIRENGNVRLTPQGEIYAKSISSVLDDLESATLKINPKPQNNRLTINLDFSLLNCWLEKAIEGFRKLHPAVEIEFVASPMPPDYDQHFDIVIYYAKNPDHDENTFTLFEDYIFLVASPELSTQLPKEDDLNALFSQTFLQCSLHPQEWQRWLNAYDIKLPDGQKKLTFNNRFSVLSSAARNVGVAIGRQPYVDIFLKENTLEIPYKKRVATGNSYFLAFSKTSAYLPIARDFQIWISEEIKKLTNIYEEAEFISDQKFRSS